MSDGKVLADVARLAARVRRLREEGKRLVFTNGCFDILHAGHVACLQAAREMGDVLLVGINSDDSVRRLKGPQRPINPLQDRLAVLAALSCVDHAIPFEDPTPERLLRIVRPEVYVKGSDYTRATLPEAPLVEEMGGTVRLLPLFPDRSTTRLIEAVRSRPPHRGAEIGTGPANPRVQPGETNLRTTMEEWRAARRVLCVRLDSLGDVLMTSPALRAIRAARSDRTLTLLTSPAGRAAAALVPQIARTLVFEAPWMKTAAPASDGVAAMVRLLRAERFDAAVIFTVYSQSALPAALLCHMAGIPLRLAHCRENPYHLLTHWVREEEPHLRVRHEVSRQLDLVARAGCDAADDRLLLRVTRSAARAVARLLRDLGLDGLDRWVVLHPGASAPSRRYPEERFAEAARILAGDLGIPVVFTGSASERLMVERIRAAMRAPSHSLAGRLTVSTLAALLARAPLLVSNNTGPVHIAAGVGTPVVVLYALTNPQHQPWRTPSRVLSHDVPCRNCHRSVCPESHHHCLARIEPSAVVSAVESLLAETSRSPAPEVRAQGALS